MTLPVALLLPALGTIGTAVLYFIGVKYHEAYYSTLRIAHARFPQETVTYLLNGVDAIRASAFDTTVRVFSDPWVWVVLALFVAAPLLILSLALDRSGSRIQVYRQPFTRSRLSKLAQFLVRYLVLLVVICYGLAFAPVLVGSVIIVPTVVGSIAGKDEANRLLDEVVRCPAVLRAGLSYARVERDGQIVGEGIVAGASGSRMVLVSRKGSAEYEVQDARISYHAGFPQGGSTSGGADAGLGSASASMSCQEIAAGAAAGSS